MKKHLVHHGVSHLDDIYARHSFPPPPTQKLSCFSGVWRREEEERRGGEAAVDSTNAA